MDLDPAVQEAVLHRTVELVLDHWRRVRALPVAPGASPAALRQRLAGFDLEFGGDPQQVSAAVADILESGTVLTTHPRYFGLFNPSPLTAGVVADVLTAGFNPQLAVWSHAPASVEMEAHVIRQVGRWLGVTRPTGSFTTGGAEANATGLLLALLAAFPDVGTKGLRGLPGRPVFYASSESHLAWLKIARQSGLGRDSVRLVGVDGRLRLDLDALEQAIRADRASGALPFLLVATAGTTSAGVIDPLEEAATIAQREGLWLHVDAAWAGSAALSDALRPHLDGIERADSITVDAHKWLSVPMGAGMFLTPHADVLGSAFEVTTSYMPAPSTGVAADPYTTSVQWSRRAIGLKLFLALAVHGRSGYAAQLENDVRLGMQLREKLHFDGWSVVNETPLPVVCFADPSRHDDGAFHDAVAANVVASGEAWVSSVRLAGRPAVRACVISHHTTLEDINDLVRVLRRVRGTN